MAAARAGSAAGGDAAISRSIVATRNDLGTLASMQNKFVRLALVRLRLSMKEFLGELPPEMGTALAAATAVCEGPPRLFVPARPGLLARGERVRISIVSTDAAPLLHTRARGQKEWLAGPARLLGRKTYEAILGPFETGLELVEYYVSAGKLTSPPEAPDGSYLITLV